VLTENSNPGIPAGVSEVCQVEEPPIHGSEVVHFAGAEIKAILEQRQQQISLEAVKKQFKNCLALS
jgi:hypothetical protein